MYIATLHTTNRRTGRTHYYVTATYNGVTHFSSGLDRTAAIRAALAAHRA